MRSFKGFFGRLKFSLGCWRRRLFSDFTLPVAKLGELRILLKELDVKAVGSKPLFK